jgi:hypothetical protein
MQRVIEYHNIKNKFDSLLFLILEKGKNLPYETSIRLIEVFNFIKEIPIKYPNLRIRKN